MNAANVNREFRHMTYIATALPPIWVGLVLTMATTKVHPLEGIRDEGRETESEDVEMRRRFDRYSDFRPSPLHSTVQHGEF